jgi:hypothetical protein
MAVLTMGVARRLCRASRNSTIGTAADWMMRFLVHPNPSLLLAAQGASLCGMPPALKELTFMLGFRDGGLRSSPGQREAVARNRTCCTGRAGA